MLKLTRHLFEWTPNAEYADFYERALYNHILASQDPVRGMMTYYVSLKPGHFKTYSSPTESFWCCVGTGMENHVKYGDSIYFHDDKSLYVNLFIPSVLNWHAKGLTVRQETRFPDSDTTHLTLTCAKPTALALEVRYPSWAHGMTVSVNGQAQPITAKPGSYATVARVWKSGDRVDITLPMRLHQEAMPDDPTKVAILYGPLVLAGQLGNEGLTAPIPYADNDQGAYFRVSDPRVPVLVTASAAAGVVAETRRRAAPDVPHGGRGPARRCHAEAVLQHLLRALHRLLGHVHPCRLDAARGGLSGRAGARARVWKRGRWMRCSPASSSRSTTTTCKARSPIRATAPTAAGTGAMRVTAAGSRSTSRRCPTRRRIWCVPTGGPRRATASLTSW